MTNKELKTQRVRIVNRQHPHYRETGFMTGEMISVLGKTPMAKVKLENCQHGTDACYVGKGDVEIDRLR